MSYLVVFALGVAVGWVLFEKPEWVRAAVTKVKGWF